MSKQFVNSFADWASKSTRRVWVLSFLLCVSSASLLVAVFLFSTRFVCLSVLVFLTAVFVSIIGDILMVLLSRNARESAYLSGAGDGIIVVDENGNVTIMNPAACAMMGWRQEDGLGRPIEEVAPLEDEQGNRVRAGNRPSTLARKERKASIVFLVFVFRKDGTKFPVEATVSPFMLRGESRGATIVFRDITERRRMDLSQRRLASIVEYSDDAIISYGLDNKILAWNKAAERTFGYRAEEIQEKSFFILFPPDFFDEANQIFQRLQKGNPIIDEELLAMTRNGRRIPVSMTVSPIQDVSGKVVEVSAILRDISKRKLEEEKLKAAREALHQSLSEKTATLTQTKISLEEEAEARMRGKENLEQKVEELAQSNRELEQFAYVASHDLREPLRKIISYAQLLESRYKSKLDINADKIIDYIVDGAGRMEKLIFDLLTYSRIGRELVAREPVDLNEIVDQSAKDLEVFLREKGIRLDIDPLPTVMANPKEMAQLFQNLLSNATKFCRTDCPHVHVTAKEGSDGWTISFADNGIGIDPKFWEKIFEPFTRLYSREEYPGTGVGLAICKKIVVGLGGKIGVDSQLGQGSTFYFTIPNAGRRGVAP